MSQLQSLLASRLFNPTRRVQATHRPQSQSDARRLERGASIHLCPARSRLDASLVQILLLSPSLPELQELQLGDNGLSSLASGADASSLLVPKLHTLNLDSNKLKDWDEIVMALQRLPWFVPVRSSCSPSLTLIFPQSLDRLILSSNTISHISVTSAAPLHIHHLSLASNLISSWSSLNALASQVPSLETLWVGDNPLLATIEEGDARLEVIARVASLQELEGSRVSSSLVRAPSSAELTLDHEQVSPTEREDAEIWYAGRITKSEASETDKEKDHPRWRELIESELAYRLQVTVLTSSTPQSTVCPRHPSKRRLQR